jgi:hypothetical protein
MLYGIFWKTGRNKIHYIYNVQYLTIYELMLQKLTFADAYDRLGANQLEKKWSVIKENTLQKTETKIWCN